MKDPEYKRIASIVWPLMFGFFIGGAIAQIGVESRMRNEAVAAGAAEWVLVSHPSGKKPVFEFRYKNED